MKKMKAQKTIYEFMYIEARLFARESYSEYSSYKMKLVRFPFHFLPAIAFTVFMMS